ncbi:MAG TPA: hypothetical protein VN902_16445 [Candidatus Acidoferrales bacterium]|jgi:hypothetical protein|nr:hypothetical protein [Candidatus Acidoferrales bacterium]
MKIIGAVILRVWICLALSGCAIASAAQTEQPVHGLWVWKSAAVLAQARGAEALRDFCREQGVDEVYVSVSARSEAQEEKELVHLIGILHRAHVRVEALLSSADADEAGKHRDTLLEHVHEILEFNRRHPEERFDGVHLDVEPQQRPENKGAGNLRFLPGLADALRAVGAVAGPAGMTVNADIQNKLLKGDVAQRRMLLTSVPRVTLMMYELSSPADGDSAAQKAGKAVKASQKFLDMAYDGLADRNLAKMAIALRTPDYGELLPQVLKALDDANRANPYYLGWARHSYNDFLQAQH